MTKPNRSEFGYSKKTGWQDERDRDLYDAALLQWYNRPRTTTGGRQRTRPIHPSWNEVLKNFDSTNKTRSQGAFCRWAGLNRATFSAMQCKPLLYHTEYLISQWVEEIECVDFGIMPQFQSEYERLMEKD